MKQNTWLLLLAVVLATACGQQAASPTQPETPAQMTTETSTKGRWSAADKQAVADRYRNSWQYRPAEDRASLDRDKWIGCVMEKLESTYDNPYRVQQALEQQSEELNNIGHSCDQASLR